MEINRSERAMEIFSRLLKDRTILLGFPIDDNVANITIAQMLLLTDEDPTADIRLYINSPGGNVTSSLAIFDTMQQVASDVSTVAIGQAAGTAAILLCSGKKGKRFALSNARVLFCPLVGPGVRTDIEKREVERISKFMIEITAHHTNQPPETIERDMNKSLVLNPEEARRYGIVDKVFDCLDKID